MKMKPRSVPFASSMALPKHKHPNVMQRGLLGLHTKELPLGLKVSQCGLEAEHEAPVPGWMGGWGIYKKGEKTKLVNFRISLVLI